MNKDVMSSIDDILSVVISVVCIVLLCILSPMLSYFCGWLIGHFLSWFIGDTVINWLNYVFNTTRFTTDMLPTICGTLGVIGSFFKSSTTSSNK